MTKIQQIAAVARATKYPDKMPDNNGDKNGMWKGDSASYQAIHIWIRKKFGTPKHCENCNGVHAKSDKYDWANISQKYTRNRKDYIRLCRSCHIKHDRYKHPVSINYPLYEPIK